MITYTSDEGLETTVAEDDPVFEFTAGDAQWAKTVGYSDVSIKYNPVDERTKQNERERNRWRTGTVYEESIVQETVLIETEQ